MDCVGFGVCGTFLVVLCFPRSKREGFGYWFDLGVGGEGDVGWAGLCGVVRWARRGEGKGE
jgi:hypothetical protein